MARKTLTLSMEITEHDINKAIRAAFEGCTPQLADYLSQKVVSKLVEVVADKSKNVKRDPRLFDPETGEPYTERRY